VAWQRQIRKKGDFVMTIKVELVDKQNGKEKDRIKCKCGKDFNIRSFDYHKLRCDAYKDTQKVPYPVSKVDEMIGKIQSNQSNQWIAKLVYSCKVGDVMKIVVPTKEEVLRITGMSRYYAKKKGLVVIYRTEKIWKGINLFLSVAKNGK
jgi:hypothetical protein